MSHWAEPSSSEFIKQLSECTDIRGFCLNLGASVDELDDLQKQCTAQDMKARKQNTLEGLYKLIRKKGKPASLSWLAIICALQKLGRKENILAETLRSEFINTASLISPVPSEIIEEFRQLNDHLITMILEIKNIITRNHYDNSLNRTISWLQDIVTMYYGLPRLEEATLEAVYKRIESRCTIINFHVLEFLAEDYDRPALKFKMQSLIRDFKESLESFKHSSRMIDVVNLARKQTNKLQQQLVPAEIGHNDCDQQSIVQLKVREFWQDFTLNQFETIMQQIFDTLYDVMTPVCVTQGCICIEWNIPSYKVSSSFNSLPTSEEFFYLIGVIHLLIGDEQKYKYDGRMPPCKTIEAVVHQAIERKNTKVIELFLSMNCMPDAAAFHEKYSIATINVVNFEKIDHRSASLTTKSRMNTPCQYVCVLGHNHKVQEIATDHHSCHSCHIIATDHHSSKASLENETLRKMYKNLQQERQQEIMLTTQSKELSEFCNIMPNDVLPSEEQPTLSYGPSNIVQVSTYYSTKVAAKRINFGIDCLDHYKEEVEKCLILQHPSIVQFIGAAFEKSTGNRHYSLIFVHELMPTSLYLELHSDYACKLKCSQIYTIAFEVCAGMCYLHHGSKHSPIVHGNIDSSHVLLEPIRDGWKAKLAVNVHEAIDDIIITRETTDADIKRFHELLDEMISCGVEHLALTKCSKCDNLCEWYSPKRQDYSSLELLKYIRGSFQIMLNTQSSDVSY